MPLHAREAAVAAVRAPNPLPADVADPDPRRGRPLTAQSLTARSLAAQACANALAGLPRLGALLSVGPGLGGEAPAAAVKA